MNRNYLNLSCIQEVHSEEVAFDPEMWRLSQSWLSEKQRKGCSKYIENMKNREQEIFSDIQGANRSQRGRDTVWWHEIKPDRNTACKILPACYGIMKSDRAHFLIFKNHFHHSKSFTYSSKNNVIISIL
jgi:hypothetical protein